MSIVREALLDVGDVPPAAGQLPHEPGVDRAGGEPARLPPASRAPGTWSSSQRSFEPEKYGSRRGPVFCAGSRARARPRASGRCRPPCAGPARRSRGAAGLPVARSQSTIVSRWFVMPIAAMSRAPSLASASACAGRVERSSSRSPRRRARPSRAAESAARTPAARRRACGPRSSKTIARELLVPWSRARRYGMRFLSVTPRPDLQQDERHPPRDLPRKRRHDPPDGFHLRMNRSG